jgi:hypothetical protein
MMNEIDFNVGDYIIAIKDHNENFKKGDIFKCHGILLAFCDCRKFIIDIGKIKDDCNEHYCLECEKLGFKTEQRLFSQTHFKKLNYEL